MSIPNEVLERNNQLNYIIQSLGLILTKMTSFGSAPINYDLLVYKHNAWLERMEEAKQKVFDEVGYSFNFNSPKDTKKALYETLGYDEVYIYDKVKREERVTTNQYALGYLYYRHKSEVLRNWGLFCRLRHRLSNFVDKLLEFDGNGNIIGYNTRYIKERDNWLYLTYVILPLAISGRLNAMDINLLQWPRNSKTWNIDCRDIICAKDDEDLISLDLSKIERLTCAILFNDPVMLEEVNLGGRAFSKMASEVFGIPEEQCSKGTDWYTAIKTSAYSHQYFAQEQTLHEYLFKNDIFIPVDECRRVLDFLDKRYEAYISNAEDFIWHIINKRNPCYITSFTGRKFDIQVPIELTGFKSLRDIKLTRNRKAKAAWAALCRKVTSLAIQSTASGDNAQLMGLRCEDGLDRFTKPNFWSEIRTLNGDWNKASLWAIIHDSLNVRCKKEYTSDCLEVMKNSAERFASLEPYFRDTRKFPAEINYEYEIFRQWDCKVPPNHKQLTKQDNPKYYFEKGVQFKQ